ncbi:MAG: hypothetical protein ACK551_03670 [Vampirovibrionales bacterium]
MTIAIGAGPSVGPGTVDLAGLKTFAKNFVKTDGLSAEDKIKFGTVDAKGLTREQVMIKGGLTGIEGLNIDFKTKDGLAIWNSIAGADGLLSAREHTQALLRFDTNEEAGVDASKFNLTKAEATAGFQKLLADAKADPKGIAKSYVALNTLGENALLDKDDASFNENATEVTTATNIVGGDFWGSIAPPATTTPTGTLQAILDKITDPTQKALVKAILEALGVK